MKPEGVFSPRYLVWEKATENLTLGKAQMNTQYIQMWFYLST